MRSVRAVHSTRVFSCVFFFFLFFRSPETQEYALHRSHPPVTLLSPGCIYACVITTARWQVADRWQIDGLCPWVWTAPAWPVHQKHNNTGGGWCRVPRTDSKLKDTRVLEDYYTLRAKEKCKFECSNYSLPREKYTAVSAINILAHKYPWQRVPSCGSSSVNACWVRKWRISQMLLPSIRSIVFIWEKRWGAAITLCHLSIK